jgi:hypothetical protein
MKQSLTRKGYVALLSVLIVSAVAATTVLIIFVTSLSATLNSGDISEAKRAKSHANACAEIGLQKLTNGSSAPCPSPCNLITTFTNEGICTLIEVNNTSGKNWRIRATGSGTRNTITKYIEVQAYRSRVGSAATVLDWKEVDGSGF